MKDDPRIEKAKEIDFDHARKMSQFLASYPPHLKDPANYQKIRRALFDTLAGSCSHSEAMEWAACAACQRRFRDRREMMQRLGFRSLGHYMQWQKIHETIKARVPLPKYNS